MDKKYSVFVSSTYEDLKEHREKVIYSLVENNYFPIAMEFFQASNDNKWERIKKTLKDCDYFILIIGGKYGDIQQDNKSFIELEYDFAIENKIPVNVFVVNSIDELKNKDVDQGEKRDSLNKFIKKIQDDKISKSYKSVEDLKSVVINSLNQLTKDNERDGWIRGGGEKTKESPKEESTNKEQINKLLEWIKSESIVLEYNPIGNDYSVFDFHKVALSESITLSLVEIWDIIRLKCLQELSEKEIGKSINSLIDKNIKISIEDRFSTKEPNVFKDSFDNLLRLFIDKKMIVPSISRKFGKMNHNECYWKLSPLGEEVNTNNYGSN